MGRRKWWAVGVVLIAFMLPGVVRVGNRSLDRAAGEHRLAAVVAELDATDPGWRLEDILAAREKAFPPDEENITTAVRQVAAHPTKEVPRLVGSEP